LREVVYTVGWWLAALALPPLRIFDKRKA